MDGVIARLERRWMVAGADVTGNNARFSPRGTRWPTPRFAPSVRGIWTKILSCGLALWVASPGAAAEPVEADIPVCEAGLAAGLWPGRGGWVFNAADLRTDFSINPAAAVQLDKLGRALAESPHSHVVVLLLPPRALVAADKVASVAGKPAYDPIAAEAGYRKLAASLRAMGLDVVDALPVARSLVSNGQTFNLPRDHHPSPDAARAMAKGLAETLRKRPEIARIYPVQWETRPGGEAHVAGSRGGELSKSCGVDVPETTYRRYKTTLVQESAEGLLAELPTPAVVMVGTSNIGDAFNLPGYLQEALGTDVLAVETDGGGVLGSLDAYLRGADWRMHPPAFLIWEFYAQGLPERRPGVPDPNIADEYRELLGAVAGGCDDKTALWKGSLQPVAAGGQSFGALSEPVSGAGSLELIFEDATVQTAGVEVRYTSGLVDRHTFGPFNRVPSLGRFFLDLAAPGEMIAEIRLRAAEARAGGAVARVCKR